MAYFIGIDQGGTKTAALAVGLDGRVLGHGFGPGACHSVDGMDVAMHGVLTAVAGACQGLGGTGGTPAPMGVVAGMSGADFPHEFGLLKAALGSALGSVWPDVPGIIVHNDSIVAMRGGTGDTYGAVVIAGTEANVSVLSPSGKHFTFGYLIHEDDLGGRALGRHALRAVFDASVGMGSPTALTPLALDHFGIPDTDALLMAYSLGRLGDGVKGMAIPLFKAALGGDAVAIGIVERFGAAMGRYAGHGLEMLGMAGAPADVVLSGSILKARTPVLRESLGAALRMRAPLARLVDAVYEPVVGAAIMALEAWSDGNAAVIGTVKGQCAAMGLVRKEDDAEC